MSEAVDAVATGQASGDEPQATANAQLTSADNRRGKATGWWAVVCIGVVLAVGTVHHLWPRATVPAQRDPRIAELWMADALPGVGPKTRDQALIALHAGKLDSLPKAARTTAHQMFSDSQQPVTTQP